MSLTFTHLKLLVQLNETPLILSSLNGRRILAIQELQKFGLVDQVSDRVFISSKGINAITHLQESLNDYVSAV